MGARRSSWPNSLRAGLVDMPLLAAGGQAPFKFIGRRIATINPLSLTQIDPFFIVLFVVCVAAMISRPLVPRLASCLCSA